MLKKMRLGGIVLASLLTVASCQNEEIVNNASQEGQQITIEAVRGLSSRTSLIPGTVADTYQTVWSADDKIYVTSADGRTTGVLTIDPNDAGSPEGTFTGFVFGNPDDLKYSVFPVPENGVISLNNVEAGEIDAPMTAEINPSTNMATFTNACAMVRLYITGLSEGDNTVTVSATDIAGTLEPSITSSGIALNQKNKANEITITGVQNAEYFFVPVYATDTQSSVTLSVKVNNSTKDVTANILKGKIAKTNSLAVRNDKLIDPSTDLNGSTEGGEGEGDNTAAYITDADDLTTALQNGATDIYVAEGEYILTNDSKGKNVTFIGTGEPEDVIITATKIGTGGENADFTLDGSNVIFENITISTNGSTYIGYARCNATYNNCIINNTYTLYGNSEFNNCEFNVSGDSYNIWTWGAPNVTFNNCTFNCDGKAVLLYGTVDTKMTVDGCTFNDNGDNTITGKAAIEIGNDYGKSYTLEVKNNTKVNGFAINPNGINTGSTLWANKNSMNTEKLSVTIDGKKVY